MNEKSVFISDVLKKEDVQEGEFNIITSGCGTGKSHWVSHTLCKWYSDIKPSDIVVVTSRALTRDQQAGSDNVVKYSREDLKYWNGELDLNTLKDTGIRICCYNEFIHAISCGVAEGRKAIERLKIVIFDECHILFSDESFIKELRWLRAWIANNIETKLIFGLSATPNIIDYYNKLKQWGVKLNYMSKEPVVRYKAKQLICTTFELLPYLLRSLEGKTIVLCPSINQCNELKKKIKNSFVFVSQHATSYTDSMKLVRDYILAHESLPDTFIDDDGSQVPLKVMICTSTAREGFNLREECGVKNIVSCCTDELHVIQFAGRCRYDIDNLVVAHTYMRADNIKPHDYLVKSRRKFAEYIQNRYCKSWFNDISHIVQHEEQGVKKFKFKKDIGAFLSYIDNTWLLPQDAFDQDRKKYYIWQETDRQEIVTQAKSCKILDKKNDNITFKAIVEFLREIGYIIEDKNSTINGRRQRFKIITGRPQTFRDFDSETDCQLCENITDDFGKEDGIQDDVQDNVQDGLQNNAVLQNEEIIEDIEKERMELKWLLN